MNSLSQFDGTMIFVSHDRMFLRGSAIASSSSAGRAGRTRRFTPIPVPTSTCSAPATRRLGAGLLSAISYQLSYQLSAISHRPSCSRELPAATQLFAAFSLAWADAFRRAPAATIARIFARQSTARFRLIWNRDFSPFRSDI